MDKSIQMSLVDYPAQLEAVLFAAGEPVPIHILCEGLQLDEAPCRQQLQLLKEEYENSARGIFLIQMEDSVQLCTKEEYAELIQKVLGNLTPSKLSQAAMETLAIIAYNQPVTRGFVEKVRGVQSNQILHSLVERELIEEAGRLEVPGRPISYRTTDVFLRAFRLQSLQELPPLPHAQETSSLHSVLDSEKEGE